jgi:GT2 family glycosyltransferase
MDSYAVDHPTVCVTVVTFNSARYIQRCLEAVYRQRGISFHVTVVDNASTDGTCEILQGFRDRAHVILLPTNVGFAEAQNRAIAAGAGEWVLTLNPDVLLEPDFLRHLIDAAAADPGAGTVCGKLLSIGHGFEPLPESRIDSAGIYFTPAMRHFDRGWRQTDAAYSEGIEYVFGASAAAALYRRAMIDDISVEGSFFDPDFFVYREDADVAWRAQLLGWRCIYTPHAVGRHVRTVTPANRRDLPAVINMHSVKNRFLMRVKNLTGGVSRRCWAAMLWRDALVVAGSLLWEPSSAMGLWRFVRQLPRAIRQRRTIMARRRASDADLAAWFAFTPASRPVRPVAEAPARKRVLRAVAETAAP